MTYSEIIKRIERNSKLDFGDIFSKSIELFKKVWRQGTVLMILVFLSQILIKFIFSFTGINESIKLKLLAVQEEGDMHQQLMYLGDYFMQIIISLFILGFFLMLLDVGFYGVVKAKDLGEKNKGLFQFFKLKYLWKLLLLFFVNMGIMMLSIFLLFLPLIYLMIPFSFSLVIFACNPDLTLREIISLSFKLGAKKWGITFLLTLVSVILGSLGVIFCCVGFFFTMSFRYLPFYLVYKETIGFNDTDEVSLFDDSGRS